MSGIYIPGERIPDTLTAFWIFPDGYVRVFGKNGDEIRGREAIPVPDHGRLIDESMIPWCVDWYVGRKRYYTTPKTVEHLPTIIPADKEGE